MKNIFFIFIFIFSCNEIKKEKFFKHTPNVNTDNTIIEIKNKPVNIEINLSTVISGNFDDYFILKKIVRLDGAKPIGEVSIIRQYENKIFIFDIQNTKQLFCYNLDGELIWEFESIGNGPLEYNVPSDFLINKKKGTIDILDNKTYKIISLNLETGVALTERNLNCYATEMVLTDEGDYLVHTTNLIDNDSLNYKLLLIDNSQNIKSKNLKIPKNQESKHFEAMRSLESFDNGIFFTETLNDTIYRIKNDTLKRAYYIDFMEKKYPTELNFKYSDKKLKELQNRSPFISAIDRVREKNGILNFMFFFDKKAYTIFYKIKEEKTFIFHTLKNGKTISDDQQIIPHGYIDDGFVDVIEPFFLEEVKKLLKTNKEFEDNLIKNKPEIYDIMMNTDSNSNPILFVYEFKNTH